MDNFVKINGIIFKKSSLSRRDERCVGVSMQEDFILVVNTKTQGPTIKFTHDEWNAFIEGVKMGQFDISKR